MLVFWNDNLRKQYHPKLIFNFKIRVQSHPVEQ